MKHQPPQTNAMGLAGFIISLVSLFACGVTSIVAVILSAIGLTKNPKGFAIAGLIIGLLGLIELAVAISVFYSVGKAIDQAGATFQGIGIQIGMMPEAEKIFDAWEENGAVPTQVEGELILGDAKDSLKNKIVYETDGESFTLRSAGIDEILDTEDDILLGPFDSLDDRIQVNGFDPDDIDWDEENMDDEWSDEATEAEGTDFGEPEDAVIEGAVGEGATNEGAEMEIDFAN